MQCHTVSARKWKMDRTVTAIIPSIVGYPLVSDTTWGASYVQKTNNKTYESVGSHLNSRTGHWVEPKLKVCCG